MNREFQQWLNRLVNDTHDLDDNAPVEAVFSSTKHADKQWNSKQRWTMKDLRELQTVVNMANVMQQPMPTSSAT